MPSGEKKSRLKKRAAPKSAARGVSLTDALAAAAWSEADTALAEALADFDETQTAANRAARKDALDRLGQALSRAGRKRGLSRIGELDAQSPFDPAQYELNVAAVKTPESVRIQARGVARGSEILVKPRVVPVQRKKRS